MTWVRLWMPPRQARYAAFCRNVSARQRYLRSRSLARYRARIEARGEPDYTRAEVQGEIGRYEGIRFVETVDPIPPAPVPAIVICTPYRSRA